ncbi:MAG: hypothetical protein ACP5M4_11050 [Acidobacteriaceae bacterium]
MTLLAAICALPAMAAVHGRDTVPQCGRAVQFTANYLAAETPADGPGFLFEIENRTEHPITLVLPVPTSAHWYARVNHMWLWRASAGRGGALVNAENANGPVFVFQPKDATASDVKTITIPAHGVHEWTEWMKDDPAIAYQPSCAHCNYPGEHDFRAVFAYAWLPARGQRIEHLLACGLRSNPVDMPPLDLPVQKKVAQK